MWDCEEWNKVKDESAGDGLKQKKTAEYLAHMPALWALSCLRCMQTGMCAGRRVSQRQRAQTKERIKLALVRLRETDSEFSSRWVWSWLHIRGRLKHLGVRCLPARQDSAVPIRGLNIPLPCYYFRRSTRLTFTHEIKAWLAHLKSTISHMLLPSS